MKVINLFFFCMLSLACFKSSWAETAIESPRTSQDFYQQGLHYGSAKENKPQLAIQNLQIAAKKGHLKAMYALGWMYYFGRGIDKDYHQAKNFFLQAAKQQLPEAQYMLGVLYSEGKGVEMDRDKAFRWTVRAAKNGHKASQSLLDKLNAPSTKKLKQ